MFIVRKKLTGKNMSVENPLYPTRENGESTNNGTTVTFFSDPKIFEDLEFN